MHLQKFVQLLGCISFGRRFFVANENSGDNQIIRTIKYFAELLD